MQTQRQLKTGAPREVVPGDSYDNSADFVQRWLAPRQGEKFPACPVFSLVYFDRNRRVLSRQALVIGRLPHRRIDFKRLLSLTSPPANAVGIVLVCTCSGDDPQDIEQDFGAVKILFSVAHDRGLMLLDVISMGRRRAKSYRDKSCCFGWTVPLRMIDKGPELESC